MEIYSILAIISAFALILWSGITIFGNGFRWCGVVVIVGALMALIFNSLSWIGWPAPPGETQAVNSAEWNIYYDLIELRGLLVAVGYFIIGVGVACFVRRSNT